MGDTAGLGNKAEACAHQDMAARNSDTRWVFFRIELSWLGAQLAKSSAGSAGFELSWLRALLAKSSAGYKELGWLQGPIFGSSLHFRQDLDSSVGTCIRGWTLGT
jgi:hypothetical protein